MNRGTKWATRVAAVIVLAVAVWQAKMAVDDMTNLLDGVFSLVPSVAVMAVCVGMLMVTFREQKAGK